MNYPDGIKFSTYECLRVVKEIIKIPEELKGFMLEIQLHIVRKSISCWLTSDAAYY